MASAPTEYEFDIFVSYRHKDNRYDGWVTEFVQNLRKELDATFKYPVTLYFDEDPVNGIREVHHVQDSISPKITCLVFIPVISQTYCDPACYSWKNELVLFHSLAANDSLGLKVKVQNGNVVPRIVPIRIHEIDQQDEILFETATSIPLRPIDFIFKSHGVNRPLRSNEDHPQDNEMKVYYRDQINKLANALKEIITCVKSPASAQVPPQRSYPSDILNSSRKKLIRIFSIVSVVVALTILYAERFWHARRPPVSEKIALAVLPFKVIGNDEAGQYFADGVMEDLISNLNRVPDFSVKPRMSVDFFRDKHPGIREIGQELGVGYLLEGSAQKFGEKIRISIKLIDIDLEETVWAQQFDNDFEDIFDVQTQISESVAKSLKASLTPALTEGFRKVPTHNFDAYDLFLRAKQASRRYSTNYHVPHAKQAIALLNEALRLDPDFALAYAWLAAIKSAGQHDGRHDRLLSDSIILLANRALLIDTSIVEAQLVLSDTYNRDQDEVSTLRYTYAALRSGTLDSATVGILLLRLASVYARIGEEERAMLFYTSLLRQDPANSEILHQKFYTVSSLHHIPGLEELANSIKKVDPQDTYLYLIRANILMEKKDYARVITECEPLRSEFSVQPSTIEQYALIYAFSLRMNHKLSEYQALYAAFEKHFGDDPFFKAQLELLKGNKELALELLSGEVIGWHTINLCKINPVFSEVWEDRRFIEFIAANVEVLNSKKERIRQLEREGYLEAPELFFARQHSFQFAGL